jgi:hypothetical protein
MKNFFTILATFMFISCPALAESGKNSKVVFVHKPEGCALMVQGHANDLLLGDLFGLFMKEATDKELSCQDERLEAKTLGFNSDGSLWARLNLDCADLESVESSNEPAGVSFLIGGKAAQRIDKVLRSVELPKIVGDEVFSPNSRISCSSVLFEGLNCKINY